VYKSINLIPYTKKSSLNVVTILPRLITLNEERNKVLD
jgi:hypothetical protein